MREFDFTFIRETLDPVKLEELGRIAARGRAWLLWCHAGDFSEVDGILSYEDPETGEGWQEIFAREDDPISPALHFAWMNGFIHPGQNSLDDFKSADQAVTIFSNELLQLGFINRDFWEAMSEGWCFTNAFFRGMCGELCDRYATLEKAFGLDAEAGEDEGPGSDWGWSDEATSYAKGHKLAELFASVERCGETAKRWAVALADLFEKLDNEQREAFFEDDESDQPGTQEAVEKFIETVNGSRPLSGRDLLYGDYSSADDAVQVFQQNVLVPVRNDELITDAEKSEIEDLIYDGDFLEGFASGLLSVTLKDSE